MRTIALEEHFVIPGFFDGPGRVLKERLQRGGARGAAVVERLAEVGGKRIAEMDEARIDMQVLSLNSPGVEQLDAAEAIAIAREANDFLAETVKSHPKRFAGICRAADAGARKGRRGIGRRRVSRASKARSSTATRAAATSTTSSSGRSWSGSKRSTFRSTCIRPCRAGPVMEALYGGFSPAVIGSLAGPGWGWHIETAIHVLRMILGGVFDQYPEAASRHRSPGRGNAVHAAAARPQPADRA